MEFNIDVRKKQLQSLSQYIKSSKDNVEAILQSLGWNAKNTVENEDPKINCLINPNHLLSFATSAEHIGLCQIRSYGYDINGDFLSDTPSPTTSTIKLDNKTKIEVLSTARFSNSTFRAAWNGHDPDPMTSDRLHSTFSADERLALYDYCVKNTEPPPEPEEFTLSVNNEKEGDKELSFEQQLIKERDAKRRRIKYKSVHTSRKSQVEITREVIDNQMDLYHQWLRQKKDTEDVLQHATDQINRLEDYSTNVASQNSVSYPNGDGVHKERPSSRLSSRHSTHSGSSRKNRPRDERGHRANGRHCSRERRESRDRRSRRRSRSRERRRHDKERPRRSPRDERSRGRDRR
ncbi:pre-mRNA-splicing factor 38B-like [Cylas formicarius]|uniref:pre-mRNA-splicing factor 38B-like n=1 Tax=Cylas formicarius TaxID=197179 RepID=UPI002958AF5D|nr:pre-mRNA-splicing factor 38B-like [Cylas formicarius]